MVSSDEKVIVMAAITLSVLENKAREKRKKKPCVKPWLQRRPQRCVFSSFYFMK